MGTSWITQKENYIAGDGWGFSDTNSMGNNLNYIRNEDATLIGVKTIEDVGAIPFIVKRTVNASVSQAFENSTGELYKFTFSASTFDVKRNTTGSAFLKFSNTSVDLGTIESSATTFLFNKGIDVTGDGLITGNGTVTGDFTIISKATFTGTEVNLLQKTIVDNAQADTFTVRRNVNASVNQLYENSTGELYRTTISASTFTIKRNLAASAFLAFANTSGTLGTIESSASAFGFDKQINPTTTPTSGTWAVADNGISIPRGIYNIGLTSGTGAVSIEQNSVVVMVNDGTFNDSAGGCICSDGINTKIYITGTGTIDYWKF